MEIIYSALFGLAVIIILLVFVLIFVGIPILCIHIFQKHGHEDSGFFIGLLLDAWIMLTFVFWQVSPNH